MVALGEGGALETVVDGVTGFLVKEAGEAAFGEMIRQALNAGFDAGVIRAHAEQFGRVRFQAEMRARVDQMMAAQSLW